MTVSFGVLVAVDLDFDGVEARFVAPLVLRRVSGVFFIACFQECP
jgi:hypothetical protein